MEDEATPLPPRPPGAARRTPPACPMCGAPPDPHARPFCSTRCAQRDLHRWLSEGYRVPTEEPPAGQE